MQFPKRINWILLVSPILIFSLGFVTLFSTSPELAQNQLGYFVIAVIIYIAVSLIDYRLWGYYWKPLYFLTLGTLILTFLIGQEVFGSARWLQFGSFNFQPSEFAKLVVLISVAYKISQNSETINSIKGVLREALYVFPLVALVLIQPDLGTSIVLGLTFATLFWFGGLKRIYFLVAILIFGIFSFPVWSFLKDYQKERILVFLNPSLDTLGASYNVIQSTIAVGSGVIFGRGFGRGTQSHLQFLPVFWTDFIFAAFAEEWGFVGVVVLLALYATLLIATLFVAMKTKDTFGSLVSIGVFIIFFFQFVINVGMNLGIMPVTGIPLPLVSYGGSSLLISAFLLGLVQSVWVHEKS